LGQVGGGAVPFHSQIGQDRFVFERYFADRRRGRFLDIGAYDGVTFSNSLFFEEELGWQGICVEPLPDVFAKLKARRKAICLNCCIADYDGVGEFLDAAPQGDARMLSGLVDNYDPRHLVGISSSNRKTRSLELPVRRLPPILDEHGFHSIDYCSIDTEGAEYQILQTIDFGRYRFSIMSIENNFADERIPELMAARGFDRVHIFHGYDELYQRRDF
jgi:FkbM family methyltransferase